MERPEHYVYLRDDDTGEYWSVSWQPCGGELSGYGAGLHDHTPFKSRNVQKTHNSAYAGPDGRRLIQTLIKDKALPEFPPAVEKVSYNDGCKVYFGDICAT